jgi:hypothetical protein
MKISNQVLIETLEKLLSHYMELQKKPESIEYADQLSNCIHKVASLIKALRGLNV